MLLDISCYLIARVFHSISFKAVLTYSGNTAPPALHLIFPSQARVGYVRASLTILSWAAQGLLTRVAAWATLFYMLSLTPPARS